ncbi:MAG: DMT family transporter [Porticoccaceae bacterium]
MLKWIYLFLAILFEVVATSFLKSSQGFTKLVPVIVVVIGYTAAFYFLALTLRLMSLGVAYAIWAGVGVVLIALIGWAFYGQALDAAALVGMAMIVAGVVVIYAFSATVSH